MAKRTARRAGKVAHPGGIPSPVHDAVAEGSWHKVNGVPRAAWEMNALIAKHGGLGNIPGYEGEVRRCVYFIQAEESRRIKIGYTAGSIERRRASLQTAN